MALGNVYRSRKKYAEAADVYTQLMFMDDRTIAQIAASGAFLGGGPGQPPFFGNNLINCDNPFLSSSMVASSAATNGRYSKTFT